MNILLANDHAGTSLKNEIKKVLEKDKERINKFSSIDKFNSWDLKFW